MAAYNVKDILDPQEATGQRNRGSLGQTTGRGLWTRKRQRMINKAHKDEARILEKERVNALGAAKG